MSLLRIYGNTGERSVFITKAEPEVNNKGRQWPELCVPTAHKKTIICRSGTGSSQPKAQQTHLCNKPTRKGEEQRNELLQLRSVVTEQRQQIRIQAEQI